MDVRDRSEPNAAARAPGRVRLFRVAGVDVDVPWILLPLLVGLAWIFATGVLPRQEGLDAYTSFGFWVLGLGGAALLFGSVLAHELAHAIVAGRVGRPVDRVTVFFHANTSALDRPPEHARDELLLAGSGPALTVALAVGCALADHAWGDARWLGPLARIGWVANGLLAVSYLLPGLPLDGGRLVRGLLWLASGDLLSATRWAFHGSRVFALFLGLASALMMARSGLLTAWSWGVLLAGVLWLQAGVAWRTTRLRERLRDRVAGDVLQPAPEALPRVLSVDDAMVAVERRVSGVRVRAWLVDFQGRLGGIVTASMMRGVPKDERASTPIGQVARRLRFEHLLSPRTGLETALERMAAAGLPLLPVVDGDRLVGVVTREAILRLVETGRAAVPSTA